MKDKKKVLPELDIKDEIVEKVPAEPVSTTLPKAKEGEQPKEGETPWHTTVVS